MASNSKKFLPLFAILAFFIMLPYLCSLVAADCYWADGSEAYDMHECYSTLGADGLCCAEGDLCLLNHLCQAPGTDTLYRGACNMPNWTQATTCPQVCDDPNTGSNLTAAQLVGECGTNDGEYFCSDGDTDCSDYDSTDLFTLSGCAQEYNTAGSATVLTALPTCTEASVPSPALNTSDAATAMLSIVADTSTRTNAGFPTVTPNPMFGQGNGMTLRAKTFRPTTSTSSSISKHVYVAFRASIGGVAGVVSAADSFLTGKCGRRILIAGVRKKMAFQFLEDFQGTRHIV